MSKPETPMVTVPLPLLIRGLLGDGYWHNRPIEPEMAELILLHTRNEGQYCYIETVDEFSEHLEKPVLWEWARWRYSSDAHERAKARSAKEMEEYMVLNHNVGLVTRALMFYAALDEQRAKQTANKWVRSGAVDKCKGVGVKRLAKTKEDL